MQFIRDIHAARLAQGKPVISFEFFPPKTDEGVDNLLGKSIPDLMRLKPDYCSVTYGAGGSTRDRTLMIVDRIQRQHGLTAMSHLTCVNARSSEVAGVLREASRLGIKNILALRGDPPGGIGEFTRTEGGFEFSHQLIRFIRQQGDFCVGAAGFPEGHIACKEGKHVDWQRLKNKVEAGAEFLLTQLFFDNRDFFEFRDYLSKHGVNIPIFPGIISILNSAQIKKFTVMCGAKIPPALLSRLEQLSADDDACAEFGIEYATKQCEDLLRGGVPGLHFYTLNKSAATTRILKNLDLA
jgi:methylenetetrahydrofolate reductase (NADPH)